MKFCSKCGKEILDEAVICPHCGCATAQQNPATTESIAPYLRDLRERVNAYYVRSIFALVLCLGIGFIFMIINFATRGGIISTQLTPTLPTEIAEYELIQKKFKRGDTLTSLSLLIMFAGIAVSIVVGLVWAM